ncbi:MAG: putative cupin superfamily sugar epimerase, partial [bacterium]
TAENWIQKLELEKHPEGGFFKETYRSTEKIAKATLPDRFSQDCSFSTAIYFLLKSDQFSAFHRIQSDELWYFHTGSPLLIHVITPSGKYNTIRLGSNIDQEELFQAVVEKGSWFGATVCKENTYSLVSCSVAPGFNFSDFELAKQNDLLQSYPEHQTIIKRLTYSS